MTDVLDVPVPVGRAPASARLRAENVSLGYAGRTVSEALDVRIPDGEFTVIVGPMPAVSRRFCGRCPGCWSRPPVPWCWTAGSISSYGAKEVARRLGLLPQTSIAPDGITVADLVARGRYPHQKLLRQWSEADEAAVVDALEATERRRPCPAGWWTNSPAASGNGSGWPWSWPSRPRCCCWTSPPRSWISRTRSSCWNCSGGSTRRQHPGGRAPRPQPRLPLRHAPDRHEGRRGGRRGTPGRGGHRRAGGTRFRPGLHGHR